MKTKLTYLLLLFLVLSSCEEQDPELFNKEFLGSDGEYTFVSPNQYAGIPLEKRTSFFFDGFDNNINNWEMVNTNDAYTTIQGGSLIFESRSTGFFLTIPMPFDKNKDFEIEASIGIATGTPPSSISNGLVWFYESLNNRPNGFNTFVFDNSRFWIGKFESRNYKGWEGWTQKAVNPYRNFNTLTIRKIKNQYYFFMNKEFVFSIPYEESIGEKIGFSVIDKNRLEIDYLKIDYIN